MHIDGMYAMSRALASKTRLRILQILARSPTASVPNKLLLMELKVPKANLSQHLSMLRAVGLVRTKFSSDCTASKEVFLLETPDKIEVLLQFLNDLAIAGEKRPRF